MCGLDEVYIRAPPSFNVGKAGRNLTLSARQAICIARGILSDSCVLMVHKPTALLSERHGKQILLLLHDYVTKGGLWGLLDKSGCCPDPPHVAQGTVDKVSTFDMANDVCRHASTCAWSRAEGFPRRESDQNGHYHDEARLADTSAS